MSLLSRTPVRGILFDKDGTLIDFNAGWIPAGIQAARRLCALAGAPGQFDVLIRRAGYQDHQNQLAAGSKWACGTTRELLADWIQELGLAGGDALLDESLDHMTEVALVHSRPVTDLSGLFSELKDMGCILGVATMDLEQAAASILESFGIRDSVDFICGCDSGYRHKPDPAMVHGFCDASGLAPEELLIVGDTPHDLEMGRAAGVGTVVAVLSGVAGREMLEPHADHVLETIAGLPELLNLNF